MLIIHDRRVPSKYLKLLKKGLPELEFLGFSLQDPEVYGSISCHPDIYLFQAGPKTIVHSPGLDAEFLKRLVSSGISLIKGDKIPSGTYPSTALYNAVRVGNNVFLNRKYADKKVLDTAAEMALKVINVPQGYTRCSVLSVSDNAFITSDSKIALSGVKHGMEVLEISPGHVTLPGETYGFIGGTGGLLLGGEVLILGDPACHPQGNEIVGFINTHSKGLICASGLPLYDAGSVFCF